VKERGAESFSEAFKRGEDGGTNRGKDPLQGETASESYRHGANISTAGN